MLFLLAQPNLSSAQESAEFVVPDFPPFTYFEDGEFRGAGIEKLKNIFADMGQPYTLRLVPNYGRAVQEVKHGRADGFLLATENDERNQFAELSNPILMNRWSWFLHKTTLLNPSDSEFKEQAQVATHLRTNTHIWLLKNDYQVVYSPSKVDSLVKALYRQRVTAVFLAEHVFWESTKRLGIDESNFRQVVEIEKPMGIYIAKPYLKDKPDFMQKLNRAIPKLVNQ